MNACGIILSGGKSSRMGTNKALLKINELPNIARVKNELEHLVEEIILVSNDVETYRFLELNTVCDDYPGQGPLAGIHAGLKHSSYDLNLVVACDMPFVSAKLGQMLLALTVTEEYDAVIPIINGKQQPLFAVYRKGIFPKIEKCIREGNLRIKQLLKELHVLYVTEQELVTCTEDELERIFFNMNHPEEYEQAKQWANKGE